MEEEEEEEEEEERNRSLVLRGTDLERTLSVNLRVFLSVGDVTGPEERVRRAECRHDEIYLYGRVYIYVASDRGERQRRASSTDEKSRVSWWKTIFMRARNDQELVRRDRDKRSCLRDSCLLLLLLLWFACFEDQKNIGKLVRKIARENNNSRISTIQKTLLNALSSFTRTLPGQRGGSRAPFMQMGIGADSIRGTGTLYRGGLLRPAGMQPIPRSNEDGVGYEERPAKFNSGVAGSPRDHCWIGASA